MKRLANVTLLVCLALSGCGKDEATTPAGSCSDSIVLGTWSRTANGITDALTFKADCTGSGLYCSSIFTYPDVTATSGTVVTHQTAYDSTKAGCGPNGTYSCAYGVSGNSLAVDCGSGQVSFTKQ